MKLHSGGALGADTYFGLTALKYGITAENQYHYFYGVQSDKNSPNGNIRISVTDYEEGRVKSAISACELYNYPYDKMKDPRICRNWVQVKYSDSIYAVTNLADIGQPLFSYGDRVAQFPFVTGDTSYAVMMALIEHLPVYVFNMANGVYKSFPVGWYTYDYESLSWVQMVTIPQFIGTNICGIGARKLTKQGEEAIEELFRANLK